LDIFKKEIDTFGELITIYILIKDLNLKLIVINGLKKKEINTVSTGVLDTWLNLKVSKYTGI
jgi:hypothetical protein